MAESRELAEVGSELARLPLDPRVARMLVAARDEGCLAEVRIIAAALSVQDPRQRPLERAEAADERHERFADEQSDFLSFLKLWKLQEESGLRRLCRENFLSYPRMREWRDVHEQLTQALDWPESSVKPEKAEGYRAIHRALLAGLLGNVGLRDEEGVYTGARGIKFWVHPGSWTKKPGKWIVAAELVELRASSRAQWRASSRAGWNRRASSQRSRSDPHWEKDRGEVVARARHTVTGLPVYANRRVPRPFDGLARDLFIRSALVEGDLGSRAPFLPTTGAGVTHRKRLEHKSRRPDILIDDDCPLLYDERIPKGSTAPPISSAGAGRRRPPSRHRQREDLMRHEAASITTEGPPIARARPEPLRARCHFSPARRAL